MIDNKTSESQITIFWFRRDLRLHDNAGLYRALTRSKNVLPIFIFDTHILDALPRNDARVQFIHDSLQGIKSQLEGLGSDLKVYLGKPEEVWQQILSNYQVNSVYCNKDYEPYAKERDASISALLAEHSISLHTFKDHLVFHEDEVLKDDGKPYTVFTPYKRKWLAKLQSRMSTPALSYYLKGYPVEKYYDQFCSIASEPILSLSDLGFEPSDICIPASSVTQKRIRSYDETRNFPAIEGTSRLGIHFRFGTISIREKARKAQQLNDTFLSELVWRDFYAMILHHFPHVVLNAFREKYDRIEWRNNKEEFEAWKEGRTGYALVDAGMRELNTTGHMHNRVRMLVASFLTKHLLIDWRWGEAYFAEKLLDFDLASNNGGWQWAAGSGTDAAPYFRIFSPMAQLEKFDKQRVYVKRYVPEYGTDAYPEPIVDHKFARERCLATYKEALS